MAGLTRKLFVNVHTKTLQVSDESSTPVDPPVMQKYETIPLCIVLVEPCSPWGPNNFQRVDITGISLTAALNNTLDDSTPLASNTTWTKNTTLNTFEGELSLNTAGMNAHIGSGETASAIFELDCTEGATARTKIYTRSVTLKGSVLPPVSTPPDQLAEYLTRQQADGLYARMHLGAGQTMTFVSPDGTIQLVLGVRDDSTFQTDILDN